VKDKEISELSESLSQSSYEYTLQMNELTTQKNLVTKLETELESQRCSNNIILHTYTVNMYKLFIGKLIIMK
jgi:hypothetical protein